MDHILPAVGTDESKMNAHFQSLLQGHKQSSAASGEDVQEIPHRGHPSGHNPTGVMKGSLMGWTAILEALDDISASVGQLSDAPEGAMDAPINPSDGYDEQKVLKELSDLFTPILVSQGFESNVADKIQCEYESAGVLTEKNIIKFDDETRMAQIIAVSALLIQKAKNTEKYRTYVKAAQIRNQMKLDMQREEYDNAKALAQKFLVQVATTNNSSIARQAAHDLLPETQH